MGTTPVEDVQKSFSGQVDAHRYEEGSDKQAENQTEFPEETNLLLLVVLCLNHTQCDKTTIFATNGSSGAHTREINALLLHESSSYEKRSNQCHDDYYSHF
jgi:hypothetical protein